MVCGVVYPGKQLQDLWLKQTVLTRRHLLCWREDVYG